MNIRISAPSPTLPKRYWLYVDRGTPDECWLWTGCTDKGGYGKIWAGYDVRGKVVMEKAHRVGWALAHGDPPGDLHVRHICDSPPCQNPRHLVLGTHADNMHDMAERGRVRGFKNGEAHRRSKLTEQDVRGIVEMRSGGATLKAIAAQYNAHYTTVQSILVGKTWAHVTGLV